MTGMKSEPAHQVSPLSLTFWFSMQQVHILKLAPSVPFHCWGFYSHHTWVPDVLVPQHAASRGTCHALQGRQAPHAAVSAAGCPPFIAWEECREHLGRHPCDQRRALSYYRARFPAVDFSLVSARLVSGKLCPMEACIKGLHVVAQPSLLRLHCIWAMRCCLAGLQACASALQTERASPLQVESEQDELWTPGTREGHADIRERGAAFLRWLMVCSRIRRQLQQSAHLVIGSAEASQGMKGRPDGVRLSLPAYILFCVNDFSSVPFLCFLDKEEL